MRRLRLNILRTLTGMAFVHVFETCVHAESSIEQRTALPPPPTVDSHYGCAWAIWANLAKLCGVCLSPADSQLREIKEVKRRIIPGGVVLSCGLPLCQVAQWRDTRTPGQLIKVRCGWMPRVTHDPCSPPPLTTHTQTHSINSFFHSLMLFIREHTPCTHSISIA